MKTTNIITALASLLVVGLSANHVAAQGSLDPTNAPGPTMKTLEEIHDKPVWPVGDTVFVDWPANPRFAVSDSYYTSTADDLVLDKETGLIWARNANLAADPGTGEDGALTLPEAQEFCYGLKMGRRMGWRLPSIEEIASLADTTVMTPALPAGHPFINVQTSSYPYWSCTANVLDSVRFWNFHFTNGGFAGHFGMLNVGWVWPVRGGVGRMDGF